MPCADRDENDISRELESAAVRLCVSTTLREGSSKIAMKRPLFGQTSTSSGGVGDVLAASGSRRASREHVRTVSRASRSSANGACSPGLGGLQAEFCASLQQRRLYARVGHRVCNRPPPFSRLPRRSRVHSRRSCPCARRNSHDAVEGGDREPRVGLGIVPRSDTPQEAARCLCGRRARGCRRCRRRERRARRDFNLPASGERCDDAGALSGQRAGVPGGGLAHRGRRAQRTDASDAARGRGVTSSLPEKSADTETIAGVAGVAPQNQRQCRKRTRSEHRLEDAGEVLASRVVQ